LKHPLSRSKME